LTKIDVGDGRVSGKDIRWMKKLRNAQISSFNCLVREVDGMGIIWGDDVVVYGAWTTANTFPGGNGHGRGRESKQKSKKSASKEDAPRGFPPFGVFFASTSTV
jgi:hypothetical protein